MIQTTLSFFRGGLQLSRSAPAKNDKKIKKDTSTSNVTSSGKKTSDKKRKALSTSENKKKKSKNVSSKMPLQECQQFENTSKVGDSEEVNPRNQMTEIEDDERKDNHIPPSSSQQKLDKPKKDKIIETKTIEKEHSSLLTSSGLSQYEIERLKNIARNEEFLRSIGVDSARDALHDNVDKRRVKSKKKVKKKAIPTRRVLPTRRSRRRAGLPVSSPTTTSATPVHQSESSDSDDYEDSSVLRYVVESTNLNSNPATEILASAQEEKDHISMKIGIPSNITSRFLDNGMKRIYGMSMVNCSTNFLLAAGGHGGRVSIFGNDELPLLSFKAHGGWVCDVHFLSSNTNCWAGRLLTASNDCSVSLWDINQARSANSRGTQMKPKCITTNRIIHRSGIFSMHCRENILITGSKDHCVGYSQIRESKIDNVSLFEEHSSVVKSARLRPGNDASVVASVGNDGVLCIWDKRSEQPLIASQTDISSLALNSVRWHPSPDSNQLVVGGFEPVLRIYDIRKLVDGPLHTLAGHHRIGRGVRLKSIHHPLWVRPSVLMTGGSKSDDLIIFDPKTGQKTSRGTVGWEPTAMTFCGDMIACAHSKEVSLLKLIS
eukprot:g4321.t1